MKEKAPYLPAHIANYFLWRAQKEGVKDMTPLKLIKLVYFAYAWNLAVFDKELFSEKIEAWKHGPVVPSVYHEFKRFNNQPIDIFAEELNEKGELYHPMVFPNDIDTLRILDTVWDVYKDKTGWDLREITHEYGSGWDNAYYLQGANSEIKKEKIIERAREAILKYRGDK